MISTLIVKVIFLIVALLLVMFYLWVTHGIIKEMFIYRFTDEVTINSMMRYDRQHKNYTKYDMTLYHQVQTASNLSFIIGCIEAFFWPVMQPIYHLIYLPIKRLTDKKKAGK